MRQISLRLVAWRKARFADLEFRRPLIKLRV